MTQGQFKALIVQTLFRPRDAARVLIAMRLPGQFLWMALGLMAVLNAIVYSVSLQGFGTADPTEAMMPQAFHAPVVFALFLFVVLVLTVLSLFWVGGKFGGTARIEDVLVVITWLQVLRLILQLGVAVLVLAAPSLAALVIILSTFWGIYILVGVVGTAHGFASSFMAFLVIVLAFFVMAVGLTIFFAATGIATMGEA